MLQILQVFSESFLYSYFLLNSLVRLANIFNLMQKWTVDIEQALNMNVQKKGQDQVMCSEVLGWTLPGEMWTKYIRPVTSLYSWAWGGHDTFVIIKVIHVDYCKFENCENKQLVIHPSTLNNHFKPLEIETSFLIKGPSGKIPATVNTTKMDCMTSM